MAPRSTLTSFALCLAVAIPAAAGEGSPAVQDADLAAQAVLAAARAHARMPDTMYASTPSERKPYYAHVPSKPVGADAGKAAKGWGVAHGGERRLPQPLARDTGPAITPETLFETVRMKTAYKTFYQAALIFAGRVPTEAERGPWANGTEFRVALRRLMTGPKFHEFLLRGANDRLLTDACCFAMRGTHFVDYINEHYRRRAEGKRSVEFFIDVRRGAQRAPLELIAHVAENDLPYTEILTADYIMANPPAAIAYGGKPAFKNREDVREFQPTRIERYYRTGDDHDVDYDQYGAYVVNPGSLATDYPHTGVLNTPGLLYRYPTTPTNRNRARARWTYWHFLGVDIENLSERAIDPAALADAGNPTMNNPACTGCHTLLDPVAGAFQNYDDFGLYRSSWRGEDSLPRSYTNRRIWGREEGELVETMSVTASRSRPQAVSIAATLRPGMRLVFDHQDSDASEGFLGISMVTLREATTGDLVSAPRRTSHIECFHDRQVVTGAGLTHTTIQPDCVAYLGLRVPRTADYVVEVQVHVRNTNRSRLAIRLWQDTPYEEGDVWYRDMREPGFEGTAAPDSERSLQWLAERLAADDRFAEATVKFWWPAIMGAEVANLPTDRSDPEFEGRLLAAEAQAQEVARLASGFRQGFRGRPYNLKDLLVEIVSSRWFRADRMTDDDPVRRVALGDAGAKRPLTPEELTNKTDAVGGFVWGRRVTGTDRYETRPFSALTERYRLIYGGIDSADVVERSRDFNATMAQVAKLHAANTACSVVLREFFLLPNERRRLFRGIDLDATPETAPRAIQRKLQDMHAWLFGEPTRLDSRDVQDAYQFFVEVWRTKSTTPWARDTNCNWYEDRRFLEGILDNAVVENPNYDFHYRTWSKSALELIGGLEFTHEELVMAETWDMMLAAMLMDYRYLHL